MQTQVARHWLLGGIVLTVGTLSGCGGDRFDPPEGPNVLGPPMVDGIWLSRSEIVLLPQEGEAWERMRDAADGSFDLPNIADQDSNHDLQTLAAALVFVRTGLQHYRELAIDHLLAVVGTDEGRDPECEYTPVKARTLAIGRNLVGYIVAADLVGLHYDGQDGSDGSKFATWIDTVRFKPNCPATGSGQWPDGDWENLREAHEGSANSEGAFAGGARIAAAMFLGDHNEVDAAWQTFRRYSGDRSTGPELRFRRSALTWSHDPEAPTGVNPPGATLGGHRVGGALINEQSRGGDFTWPPPYTRSPWEALQGYFAQANLLARAGHDAWKVMDRAPLRALDYQFYLATELDDARWWDRMDWVKYLANHVYGTEYPVHGPADNGRNMAWTDWTHGAPSSAAPTDP